MQRAVVLASRYRIIVDRTADHLFTATCAELPGLSGRGLIVDAAVDALRGALAASLPALVASGMAPTPLREREGPLGRWAADLEIVDAGIRPPRGTRELQKPVPSALRAIAQWTADQYRIILEPNEDGGFTAASPEMPDLVAAAPTPAAAVAELRWQLADRAYAILDAGATPPEPVKDIEARRAPSASRPYIAMVA